MARTAYDRIMSQEGELMRKVLVLDRQMKVRPEVEEAWIEHRRGERREANLHEARATAVFMGVQAVNLAAWAVERPEEFDDRLQRTDQLISVTMQNVVEQGSYEDFTTRESPSSLLAEMPPAIRQFVLRRLAANALDACLNDVELARQAVDRALQGARADSPLRDIDLLQQGAGHYYGYIQETSNIQLADVAQPHSLAELQAFAGILAEEPEAPEEESLTLPIILHSTVDWTKRKIKEFMRAA